MRHRYLVAYDVSDAKRLRKVHRKLLGYGDPLQYSVFQCDLARAELLKLRQQLGELIHHASDRVMFVDIGPVAGRGAVSFEWLGLRPEEKEEQVAVIV